jgi:hypothetical protein
MIKTLTLHNTKAQLEWGPHMDPTPLCLGVVSLLCSVSVRITPRLVYSSYGCKFWLRLETLSLPHIFLKSSTVFTYFIHTGHVMGYFVDQVVSGSWLRLCCGFYCRQWKLWCYLSLLIQLLLECKCLWVNLLFSSFTWNIFSNLLLEFKLFMYLCIFLFFFLICVFWHSSQLEFDSVVYWRSSSSSWLWYCGKMDTEE